MAKIKDRYARALFKISEESNTLEEDLKQVIFLRNNLDDEDVQVFITHPTISNVEKYKLFDKAFSNKLNKHIMGFLYLMVKRNREPYILPALTAYIELANRHFARISARLVSAVPLSDDQVKSISNIIEKKTNMEVDMKIEIDTDIIGGYYVLVEGKIFDNTIRASLNKMKKQFYKGKVLARVVSAKELSKNQIQSITNLLTRKLNNQVQINVVVDPDLIGGFYVVVDGHVYDGTVRTELKNMKNSLKREKREENSNGK